MPKKISSPVRVIETHDYMSIRGPGWTFTMGYGGDKASGTLADSPVSFDLMIEFVKSRIGEGKMKCGEAMRLLATEENLDKVFPKWNEPIPVIKVGNKVRCTGLFKDRYPKVYEVVQVKRSNAFIRLDAPRPGLTGFPITNLEIVS
jgi:hypothetical protein